MPYNATQDPYNGRSQDLDSSGSRAALALFSDSTDVPIYPKGLRVYVPTSLAEANVLVTPMASPADGDTVTLRFPPGLSYEPLRVRRIWATGTTAGVEIHLIWE